MCPLRGFQAALGYDYTLINTLARPGAELAVSAGSVASLHLI